MPYLSSAIIGAAIEVHRALGPGLLQSAYEQFLVADMIVVEVKAVDTLLDIHQAELLSYLKLGRWKLGLPINFHVSLLRDGVKRVVLGLEELSE